MDDMAAYDMFDIERMFSALITLAVPGLPVRSRGSTAGTVGDPMEAEMNGIAVGRWTSPRPSPGARDRSRRWTN
jgi:hypothetical protein